MKEFAVTAKVLNMEFGEMVVTRYVMADNEKQASDNFIKKYLTIEVLQVVPAF